MPAMACVLRSGGDYGPEWVRKLAAGLHAHGAPMQLACLTDMYDAPSLPDVRWEPLRFDWPGWYAKLELFRPGLFSGPVLYLDLDTLILGDLTPLLDWTDNLQPGEMGILTDFYTPRRAQSAVMAWHPSPETEAIWSNWQSLSHEDRKRWWSDQPFIDACRPDAQRLQDHLPAGFIASLKVHGKGDEPEGCAVLCFHGQPRPNDPEAGWAHERWEAL